MRASSKWLGYRASTPEDANPMCGFESRRPLQKDDDVEKTLRDRI